MDEGEGKPGARNWARERLGKRRTGESRERLGENILGRERERESDYYKRRGTAVKPGAGRAEQLERLGPNLATASR